VPLKVLNATNNFQPVAYSQSLDLEVHGWADGVRSGNRSRGSGVRKPFTYRLHNTLLLSNFGWSDLH